MAKFLSPDVYTKKAIELVANVNCNESTGNGTIFHEKNGTITDIIKFELIGNSMEIPTICKEDDEYANIWKMTGYFIHDNVKYFFFRLEKRIYDSETDELTKIIPLYSETGMDIDNGEVYQAWCKANGFVEPTNNQEAENE